MIVTECHLNIPDLANLELNYLAQLKSLPFTKFSAILVVENSFVVEPMIRRTLKAHCMKFTSLGGPVGDQRGFQRSRSGQHEVE